MLLLLVIPLIKNIQANPYSAYCSGQTSLFPSYIDLLKQIYSKQLIECFVHIVLVKTFNQSTFYQLILRSKAAYCCHQDESFSDLKEDNE